MKLFLHAAGLQWQTQIFVCIVIAPARPHVSPRVSGTTSTPNWYCANQRPSASPDEIVPMCPPTYVRVVKICTDSERPRTSPDRIVPARPSASPWVPGMGREVEPNGQRPPTSPQAIVPRVPGGHLTEMMASPKAGTFGDEIIVLACPAVPQDAASHFFSVAASGGRMRHQAADPGTARKGRKSEPTGSLPCRHTGKNNQNRLILTVSPSTGLSEAKPLRDDPGTIAKSKGKPV